MVEKGTAVSMKTSDGPVVFGRVTNADHFAAGYLFVDWGERLPQRVPVSWLTICECQPHPNRDCPIHGDGN